MDINRSQKVVCIHGVRARACVRSCLLVYAFLSLSPSRARSRCISGIPSRSLLLCSACACR